MPTSTEQINELIAGFTALKAYFEGAEDNINSRLNAAAATWAEDSAAFYVDIQVGNDANDGTAGSPLQTWQEAINRTPPRGRCTIFSRGDLTLSARVQGYGRQVHIVACVGADWAVAIAQDRPSLTFSVVDVGGVAHVLGFSCAYGGAFALNGFEIIWPSAGDAAGLISSNSFSVLFARENTARGVPGYVGLNSCSIALPVDPLGHLLGNVPGFILVVSSLTWSGDRTGLVTPFGVDGAGTETIGHLLTTNYDTL